MVYEIIDSNMSLNGIHITEFHVNNVGFMIKYLPMRYHLELSHNFDCSILMLIRQVLKNFIHLDCEYHGLEYIKAVYFKNLMDIFVFESQKKHNDMNFDKL